MSIKDPAQPPQVKIGILGGTGLYEMERVENIREVDLETPFGRPSDSFIVGDLEGRGVAFLSRHGRGHRFLPSEINYRANICGFKMLGVERLISVNSVGSLKEDIRPLDIVLADQFFDRTRRPNTFFGGGIAAHISLAHPVCSSLAGVIAEVGRDLGQRIRSGGTYLCIEGPAFSTIAESNIYRSWGCDIIGMTGATEARLCREAEICYATMSLVTDYDVWHETEEGVSVELILSNLRQNVENAKAVIRTAVGRLTEARGAECGCRDALKNCIVTRREDMPSDVRERLRPIAGRYL